MSLVARQFNILCLYFFATSIGLSSNNNNNNNNNNCLPFCCPPGWSLDTSSWACAKTSVQQNVIRDDLMVGSSSSSCSQQQEQNFIPSCSSGDTPEEIALADSDLAQRIKSVQITRSLGKYEISLSPHGRIETFFNVVPNDRRNIRRRKAKFGDKFGREKEEAENKEKMDLAGNEIGNRSRASVTVPGNIPSAFCLERAVGSDSQR